MGIVDFLGFPAASSLCSKYRDWPVRASTRQNQSIIMRGPAHWVHRRIMTGKLKKLWPLAIDFFPDDHSAIIGTRGQNVSKLWMGPSNLPNLIKHKNINSFGNRHYIITGGTYRALMATKICCQCLRSIFYIIYSDWTVRRASSKTTSIVIHLGIMLVV